MFKSAIVFVTVMWSVLGATNKRGGLALDRSLLSRFGAFKAANDQRMLN